MDGAQVAAWCAAIVGAGAVLTGLFRMFRQVTRAADKWSEISELFTENKDGSSIPQRLKRLEDMAGDTVLQSRGR